MRSIISGWVMKATLRMAWPQRGQHTGSTRAPAFVSGITWASRLLLLPSAVDPEVAPFEVSS
jgi:hypothetical protein